MAAHAADREGRLQLKSEGPWRDAQLDEELPKIDCEGGEMPNAEYINSTQVRQGGSQQPGGQDGKLLGARNA